MRTARERPGAALRGLALAGATGLAGLALVAAPAGARATTSFSATASADVVHASTFVVDAPLAESLVDAGSPSAATSLDTVGNSVAQAAAAYPGDTAADNPGTVRGVLPFPAPVPDVPFIASSRFPSPESSETTAGPFALSARSEERRSRAEATGAALDMSGFGLGRASAHALTSTDGTSVLAESGNDVSGFDGQGLRISGVHSLARVAFDGSRTTPTSEFAVTGLSVAGTALEVGPRGLSLAGQLTPLPPTSPLLRILADQGLHVRYLEPVQTRTSVLSAGLQVSREIEPPPGSPFGTVTQSLLLGRSTASLSNVSSSAVAPPRDAGALPPGPAPASVPSQGPAGADGPPAGDAVPPDGDGTTPDPVVGSPGDLPGLPSASSPGTDVPAPPAADAGSAQPPAPRQALAASDAALPRALDLYPPFVIGAVGLLLISQAARVLGVRRP